MPSSTIERRSSGSMTPRSASVTWSSLGSAIAAHSRKGAKPGPRGVREVLALGAAWWRGKWWLGQMSKATLHTSAGAIVLELHDDDAPKTVENFRKLAAEGSTTPSSFTGSSPTS